MSIEQKATLVQVLPNNSAFFTFDDGRQAYMPPKLTATLPDRTLGSQWMVVPAPNYPDHLSDRVPFRVLSFRPAEGNAPETTDQDREVFDYINNNRGVWDAEDVVVEIWNKELTAENLRQAAESLTALAARGQLFCAKIHKPLTQPSVYQFYFVEMEDLWVETNGE